MRFRWHDGLVWKTPPIFVWKKQHRRRKEMPISLAVVKRDNFWRGLLFVSIRIEGFFNTYHCCQTLIKNGKFNVVEGKHKLFHRHMKYFFLLLFCMIMLDCCTIPIHCYDSINTRKKSIWMKSSRWNIVMKCVSLIGCIEKRLDF